MEAPIDLVRGCYLTPINNVVWCIDGTYIKSGVVLVVLELNSRVVLSHMYIPGVTSNEFSSQHVIAILEGALEKRGNPMSVIVHSDRGGQFTSEEYFNFCKARNIHRSLQEGKFGNQVVESWNSKFKERLVDLLNMHAQRPMKWHDLTHLQTLPYDVVSSLVWKAIELCNNEPHVANFSLPPSHADIAFDLTKEDSSLALLSKKGLVSGNEIEAYRAFVMERYAGNWADFFLAWRKETSETARVTREGFNATIEGLKKLNVALLEQKEEQARRLNEQSAKIDLLVTALKKAEEEKASKELARQKRKEAKRMPPRDCMSPDLFFEALATHVYPSALVRARIRVTMVFLYLTGLRVSNVLKFTVGICQNLLKRKPVPLHLIKRGGTRLLELPSYSAKYIHAIDEDIRLLCTDKKSEDPLFHSKLGSTKAISREAFTNQLNKTLDAVSETCNLNLKSHSFRISLVTDLLRASVPIQEVSAIMGHKSIQTTVGYDVSQMTVERTRGVQRAVSLFRAKQLNEAQKATKPKKELNKNKKNKETSKQKSRKKLC
jgi:site-specific recombinase XerD